MRLELFGYVFAAFQVSDNVVKFFKLGFVFPVSLQVFSELASTLNHSHSLQDLMKFSKLLISTFFKFLPARASAMASFVSSFGSVYTTSRRIHSTKLFRLLCSRLAALFKASNRSLSSLNAVCFLIATSMISIFFEAKIVNI